MTRGIICNLWLALLLLKQDMKSDDMIKIETVKYVNFGIPNVGLDLIIKESHFHFISLTGQAFGSYTLKT